MGFLSVLGMARRLVEERVAPGSAVLDATCGNGVDTQFLAELVGPRGTVYAFDIQAAALARTRQRLAEAGLGVGGAGAFGIASDWARADGPEAPDAPEAPEARDAPEAPVAPDAPSRALRLVHASHAEMDKHVSEAHCGALAAVMFNLGYLPGADQTVITEPASTLAALEAALSLLRPGGIITAVLYPGHPGGREEAEAVSAWAAALSQSAGQSMLYRMVQKAEAPYLIAVEKKAAVRNRL